MLRILFVDDDPNVLDGLRRALRKKKDEWQMFFAPGGKEAIEMFKQDPFDVIVSDMQMPGMNGAELLNIVADLYPQTVRIVLSGQASAPSLIKSLGSTHRFLSKPCETEELIRIVDRAASLRKLLQNQTSHAAINISDSLPTLPESYKKINDLLKSDNSSLSEIATQLANDQAMVAQILHIANSAFFGFGGKVDNINLAITLLGVNLIRNIVLACEVFDTISQKGHDFFGIREKWRHSLSVATIAKKIAEEMKLSDAIKETCFSAGILHDVGKIVLIKRFTKGMGNAFQKIDVDALEEFEKANNSLGICHAKLGGYILGLWGLPDNIVEAVTYHHSPWNVTSFSCEVISIVSIANELDNLKYGPSGKKDFLYVDNDQEKLIGYIQQLNLQDKFQTWLIDNAI